MKLPAEPSRSSRSEPQRVLGVALPVRAGTDRPQPALIVKFRVRQLALPECPGTIPEVPTPCLSKFEISAALPILCA